MENEEKKITEITHKEGFTDLTFKRIEIIPKGYGDYIKPNKRFLPRYPFMDYEKCCLADIADGAICNSKGIERHRLLMPNELALIKKAVGSILILTIKVFLVQKCSVQNIDNLSWPEILEHCKYWLSQNSKKTTMETMSIEARVMAVLVDHPDWTNKKIAEVIGVHVKTLSKLQKFKAARNASKAGNAPPKGHYKCNSDGTKYIEAHSDDLQ
jgi:hypothetical protein